MVKDVEAARHPHVFIRFALDGLFDEVRRKVQLSEPLGSPAGPQQQLRKLHSLPGRVGGLAPQAAGTQQMLQPLRHALSICRLSRCRQRPRERIVRAERPLVVERQFGSLGLVLIGQHLHVCGMDRDALGGTTSVSQHLSDEWMAKPQAPRRTAFGYAGTHGFPDRRAGHRSWFS